MKLQQSIGVAKLYKREEELDDQRPDALISRYPETGLFADCKRLVGRDTLNRPHERLWRRNGVIFRNFRRVSSVHRATTTERGAIDDPQLQEEDWQVPALR